MRLLRLPLRAQDVVQYVLLFGFFVLLLLISGIAYLAKESFIDVEDQMAAIHETETNHLYLILRISETAGKMVTEARSVLATGNDRLLNYPAKQNLNTLKSEMDELVKQGRNSRVAQWEEWKAFEEAYAGYWAAVSRDQAEDWPAERQKMEYAIKSLEQKTQIESEKNQAFIKDLSGKARKKVVTATLTAMVLGVIVAALTLYEIRRIVNRLSLAYRETAEARDYLESLFDSMMSGVIVINRDGTVRTVSKSFQRLTGLDPNHFLGKSYKELLGDKMALATAVADELRTNPERNRYFGRVELGEGRMFDVFASPLLIAGENQGLILDFVDITETERAQSELRRSRALTAIGQMTAQIAHEIKNPLGSIRFATEIIKRQPTIDDESLETVSVIERSVDHLAAVVAELSEFARPKQLDLKEVDLNKLLDDLTPMIVDRLSDKGITLKRDYSNIPHGHYDPTELRKLFLNLIINAIEASEEGDTIELRTGLDRGRSVVVEVKDEGSGMDQETLRRLFEPFYTTKQRGTGLGMAISKKIAELHQGDLIVTSKEGEGTEVRVRLPLEYIKDGQHIRQV
jgi:PAS domain S-box-containing protein